MIKRISNSMMMINKEIKNNNNNNRIKNRNKRNKVFKRKSLILKGLEIR